MRTLINFLAIIIINTLTINTVIAQDLIYKKNSEVIEAKVLESSDSELKYRNFSDSEGVIYVVDKSLLYKVEYQNGTIETYKERMDLIDNPEVYSDHAKNIVKISFLGPMLDYANLIYEKNVAPGQSWEAKISIIGLGLDTDAINRRQEKGIVGSFSYKLYRKPSYYLAKHKRSHLLQGGYIRPEVFFGRNSYNETNYHYDYESGRGNYETVTEKSSIIGGFLVNVGKQWIFADCVVLDIAAGVGYGGGDSRHAFFVGEGTSLAGSVTMNVGYAF